MGTSKSVRDRERDKNNTGVIETELQRDCVRKSEIISVCVCKRDECLLSEEEREEERVSEKGGIEGRGGVEEEEEEGEAIERLVVCPFDLQREPRAEKQEECERLRHV